MEQLEIAQIETNGYNSATRKKLVFLPHNQSVENAMQSQLEFPTVDKKAQSVLQVIYNYCAGGNISHCAVDEVHF